MKSHPNPKFAKLSRATSTTRERNDPEGPGRERVRKDNRRHSSDVAKTRRAR